MRLYVEILLRGWARIVTACSVWRIEDRDGRFYLLRRPLHSRTAFQDHYQVESDSLHCLRDVLETIEAHDGASAGATTWRIILPGNRCVQVKRQVLPWHASAETFVGVGETPPASERELDDRRETCCRQTNY